MRRILSFFALMCLTACIYPFSPDLPAFEDSDVIAVSGDILIGEQTRIRINAVSPIGSGLSSTRKNVVQASSVAVEGRKGGIAAQDRPDADGTYVLDTRKLSPDDEYRLRIEVGSDKYETPFMTVRPAPEITSLDYVYDKTRLHLRIGLDGGANLSDFRWDYTENWEYHAYFVPNIMYVPGTGTENPARIYRTPTLEEDYYYCWNSSDSVQPCTASTSGQSENRIKDMEFLSMSRTDSRLSVLYSILVTARGLSPEGRAYLDYLASTSNITGDLFTPVPSNMSGNIRCVTDSSRTAVGFVDVTRSVSKRIFISYEGVYISTVNPDTYLYVPEYDEEEHSYHFEDIYRSGDAPVFCSSSEVPPEPTRTNVQWAPKWCSDCRESGGTKEKPEWWPNNHK